ncbi:hypothetical protein [Streptomyces graminilatus]|uniref:hypothetical protein n=1 Tax=Streptomyces graminilatus TaxID=1464070 RepID=UPI000B19DC92|nr:hypothetical protein [Streptomyces graminilatus]
MSGIRRDRSAVVGLGDQHALALAAEKNPANGPPAVDGISAGIGIGIGIGSERAGT